MNDAFCIGDNVRRRDRCSWLPVGDTFTIVAMHHQEGYVELSNGSFETFAWLIKA